METETLNESKLKEKDTADIIEILRNHATNLINQVNNITKLNFIIKYLEDNLNDKSR